MLIINNVAQFEQVYDIAVKLYPEIKDTTLLVSMGHGDTLSLSVGVNDGDDGKYKLIIGTKEDVAENTYSFIVGMASFIIHRRDILSGKEDCYDCTVSEETKKEMEDIIEKISKVYLESQREEQ